MHIKIQLRACVCACVQREMKNERTDDSMIQVLRILQARESNAATGGGGYFMAPIYV